MSDKATSKLNPLDVLVQRTARCGMTVGTVMSIEYISGFELFNTRPYHNYETWSQGWRVRGLGIQAEREDLDDAVKDWCEAVTLKRDGGDVQPRHVDRQQPRAALLDDWITASVKA